MKLANPDGYEVPTHHSAEVKACMTSITPEVEAELMSLTNMLARSCRLSTKEAAGRARLIAAIAITTFMSDREAMQKAGVL